MSKGSLYRRPVRFAIIFVLLFLSALTSSIIPPHLTDDSVHGFRTAFSFSEISAKSDVNSVILPQHTIDKVNPANLDLPFILDIQNPNS